ncbi:unnamed protein product [Coregonus sp. 'balchen']|nr:unnamed protein product [Coregonus sp. 'balchen']
MPKEAVLEYGKCPQCSKMDWSTCINRLTKVQKIMHCESQQRTHKAAQSEVQPKPETTSAPIKEPKPEEDPVPTLPPPRLSTTTPRRQGPIPASQKTRSSQLAIQQSADSTPSMSQSGSHMLTSSSRKRHHFSSCCSKHSKRSRSSHRRRRSPSSSSSSSYWSSEDGFCPSGKWRRSQRESRQAVRSERRHGEVVQQRLEAQQQAIQLQWAILEKRIEALERKGAEAVVSFPTSAQTIHLHASIPQASTCSQESKQLASRLPVSSLQPDDSGQLLYKEAPISAERWCFTETLVERMYQTAGMLAKMANYLRYLSDYQRRLLLEITEDRSAQSFVAVLNELKVIGQFTLQLSSHQAELSGRVLASSVAIRRQVWMAKNNYTDSLKATVADLPLVVSHTFGISSASGSSSTGMLCKQEP